MVRTGVRIWPLAVAVVLSVFLAEATPAAAAKCGVLTATIVGTPGNDVIVGTPRRDVIRALGGHDLIRALAGKDRICGGAGHDRIHAGRGVDIVRAGAGADRIWGGAGNDVILDGDGSDVTYGGAGADQNFRSDGDVEATPIVPGGGSDSFFGGAGDDHYVDGAGSDLAELGLGDDDALETNGVLGDGGGNDVYRGGDGSDALGYWLWSSGTDVLEGGAGTDSVGFRPASLRYGGYPGPVLINLTTGQVQGVGEGTDTVRSVENASGTPHSDTLIGNADPNVLDGGPPYDFASNFDPLDHIEGLDGDDRLVIYLNTGFLDGGNGTDTCLGGDTVLNCELTAAARLHRLFPRGRTASP